MTRIIQFFWLTLHIWQIHNSSFGLWHGKSVFKTKRGSKSEKAFLSPSKILCWCMMSHFWHFFHTQEWRKCHLDTRKCWTMILAENFEENSSSLPEIPTVLPFIYTDNVLKTAIFIKARICINYKWLNLYLIKCFILLSKETELLGVQSRKMINHLF